MYVLHVSQLRQFYPCKPQWDMVNAIFPDGDIPITADSWDMAASAGVHLRWAVYALFKEEAQREYAKRVIAEYDKCSAIISDVYNRYDEIDYPKYRTLRLEAITARDMAERAIQREFLLNTENWIEGLLIETL